MKRIATIFFLLVLLASFAGAATIQKFPGSPFLYDSTTGKMVGIKESDGTESLFANWIASNLSITGQAAGDILYFNGTQWTRLAKDAGKYLKSGASAVSWDTPAVAAGDIESVGDCTTGACASFSIGGIALGDSSPDNDGEFGFASAEYLFYGGALAPATSNFFALGSGAKQWSDLFIGDGGVLNFSNGDITLTHSENTLTLGGGDLALGSNNLTMTGSLGATGAGKLTKGWFTDLEITNMPTVNGTALDSTFMPIGWISRAGTNNVLTYTGNYSLGITLSGNTAITLPESGTLATTSFKPSDLSIANQAAGDVLYFDGTNWVRLAKDSGKYLKSGDLAVSWDTPAGGAGDVTSEAGTYAAGSLVVYKDNTGDVIGVPSLLSGIVKSTSGVIGEAAASDVVGLFGSGSCSGYLKSDGTCDSPQAQSDILDGIAGVTPANNGIFGYNNSGTLGLYTNHSHDDSAAHYFNAADPTKLFQYDLQYMTTGKKITYQPTAVDNYSYKVTITGNTDVTMPTSGTLATVKTEKIASFAWDGGGSAVATAGSKRCVLIPVAYTVTGYNMVVDQDPGAGTTILNLDKDAIGDGTALATTDMDGTSHAYPPTVPDNKVSVNDTTITGWTTAVSANDMICAAVATNAVATWISLSIYGTK